MIRFAIANPLLTNLLLVIVIILGVLSWRAMPEEMFPVVQLDAVSINVEFEGASPEEVESQVTIPVEEEFDGMAEIDVMTSSSSEGMSSTIIELKSGTNVDQYMRDAQTALDQITDLPEEAEEPELVRLKTRFPVISMTLYGDVARGYLYDMADDIKQRMLQIPGIASVGVAGNREWEIWVEVDPYHLAARAVSLGQVLVAVRANLRDLPGGSLKAQEGDILLRGRGVAPDPEQIAGIVIRSNPSGGQLKLGEVAHIEQRLEEAQTIGRFNGRPSVNLTVTKTADASTIDVADAVRVFASELENTLPPSIRVGLFSDLSNYVKTRLNTVKSSGLVGLVLVLLSLYLFLNFRVALITAFGIPVSFLVAVAAIHYLGYTINMVSLFAFLIALGLIVDDAIIVTENVYRHMEMGKPAAQAARVGAREVLWPVVASTTTTVAAFLPMFAIQGILGAFIAVIPVVVSGALLGSLWEAFGVLPSHAAELLRVEKNSRNRRIDWKALLERYAGLLRWSLHNRYFVALFTIGVLALAVTWATTRIPFLLFGHVDIGQFFVNAEAPQTYSLEDTAKLARQMETVVLDSMDADELDTLLTNVGVSFIDFNRFQTGSHYIQLVIDLKKQTPRGFIERFITPLVSLKFRWEGTRERPTEDIINELREKFRGIAGISRVSIQRPQGGPAGADIEVGITGLDVNVLREQAGRIMDYLERLPGVHDVRQNLEPGKLEYQYSLNDRGRELGLTQNDLADAVRTGFLGVEAVHVTFGDERIPVRVIYPENIRQSSDLDNLPLTLDDGRLVYLGDVADIVPGRGMNTISRRDTRRLALVTAEVDDQVTTPLQVTELVRAEFADLEQQLPGYRMLFLGEKKEAAESFQGMRDALLIAGAFIFFILVALFRSLIDPLVIMFSIPFGFIGVVVGHILFGYNLQFLSMIGFLALTGIVVNDSLILIHFAERMRREGLSRVEAMIEAGRVRARPILLTSVTTFLGISPLIFFATGQTAFLSPMAVSLGFGLLFATGIILIAIPCFYLIANDMKQKVYTQVCAWFGREPADEH
ncbi:MAG: efflux RND transporter permease subunit [Gammaproteobacteria bacterium]|nr:MAG: efflux RND transporter permease subunit [Gammaproteobacteria bacterium]